MGQPEVLSSLRKGTRETNQLMEELGVERSSINASIVKLKKYYNIITKVVQEGSRRRSFHTLVE